LAPGQQQNQDNVEEKGMLNGSITFESQAQTPTTGQSFFYLNLLERLSIEIPSPRPRFTGYALQRLRMAA
jgi:hypothetical protein